MTIEQLKFTVLISGTQFIAEEIAGKSAGTAKVGGNIIPLFIDGITKDIGSIYEATVLPGLEFICYQGQPGSIPKVFGLIAAVEFVIIMIGLLLSVYICDERHYWSQFPRDDECCWYCAIVLSYGEPL